MTRAPRMHHTFQGPHPMPCLCCRSNSPSNLLPPMASCVMRPLTFLYESGNEPSNSLSGGGNIGEAVLPGSKHMDQLWHAQV